MPSFHDAQTPEDVPTVGGEHYPLSSQQDEKLQEILERVIYLLDVAVIPYHRGQGRHVLECQMCGMWDDHREGCPVPSLESWLARSLD